MNGGKKLLYVDPGCPACAEVKKILKPQIRAGEVELVRDGSKKAKEILGQVRVKYVPECIMETSPGKFARCSIDSLVKEAGKNERLVR